jgi:transketolase
LHQEGHSSRLETQYVIRFNVKIGATHAGITVGEDGASHQTVEDIALMRAIPNMNVICPADAVETRAAVKAAIDTNGPFYLRLGRLGVPAVYDESSYKFELGKGNVIKDGSDITIIATGFMVGQAIEAGRFSNGKEINARIINYTYNKAYR